MALFRSVWRASGVPGITPPLSAVGAGSGIGLLLIGSIRDTVGSDSYALSHCARVTCASLPSVSPGPWSKFRSNLRSMSRFRFLLLSCYAWLSLEWLLTIVHSAWLQEIS